MGRAARSAALGAAATAAVALGTIGAATALRAAEVTEAEAQAIGLDAYLYFYPLITMDLTRRQLTNIEAGKSEIGGPPNMFVNVQAFPTAELRAVVRPNFDTLYSSGWLDMTKEPMVDLRARYGRALLSAADARHVDGRVRLARLAHDRHGGGKLPRDAAGLAPGSA